MNLVVGATGFLGTEICRLLAQSQKPVRALIRQTSDPARVAALQNLGIELTVGDLKDRASVDAACRGATTVISTANTIRTAQPGDTIESVDRDGNIYLVDAARAAGVKHFIFVSISGNLNVPNPLHAAKREVEEHLRQGAMRYTILRPASFSEVWLSPALGFDYVQGKVVVFGTGHSLTSYVSLRDVARFAVACLDHPAASNATIEVGGPEALSAREAVAIFEAATGRQFEVQNVPEAALEAQFAEADNPIAKTLAGLAIAAAHGDVIPMEETLQHFPMSLTTVRDYARSVAEHLQQQKR